MRALRLELGDCEQLSAILCVSSFEWTPLGSFYRLVGSAAPDPHKKGREIKAEGVLL